MKHLNNSKLRRLKGKAREDYLKIGRIRTDLRMDRACRAVGDSLADMLQQSMMGEGAMRKFLSAVEKGPKHKRVKVHPWGQRITWD